MVFEEALPLRGPPPAPPQAGPRGRGGSQQNLLFSQGFSMGSIGSAADPGAVPWAAPRGRGLLAAGFC